MKKKQPAKQRKQQKRLRDQRGSELKQAIIRIVGISLVVALLGIIAVMVASQLIKDVPLLEAPRKLVARIITPVQNSFSSVTDAVADYFRKLKYRSNLEYEYEQLRIRLDEAIDRAMLADERARQLQRYADLDDELTRNMNLDGIKANVIGRAPNNYTFVITIDVGRNQGVEDNMAVVVPGALVGYTFDVKANSASVRGIVDTAATVHALIESSRDQGGISGTLAIDGTYACRMYTLTQYSSLPRPGDRIITSGQGMPFPKGIPIGYVRESTRGLEDSKQYIVVEPIANFEQLEYVIVYRYRPGSAEPVEGRAAQPQATFLPLPSLLPVPTFIGQKEPVVTPGPDGEIPATETPAPTATPTAEPSPSPTLDPDATPPPPNYSYNDLVIVEASPEPEPTNSPTPTAAPTATFSVKDMTVEEEP